MEGYRSTERRSQRKLFDVQYVAQVDAPPERIALAAPSVLGCSLALRYAVISRKILNGERAYFVCCEGLYREMRTLRRYGAVLLRGRRHAAVLFSAPYRRPLGAFPAIDVSRMPQWRFSAVGRQAMPSRRYRIVRAVCRGGAFFLPQVSVRWKR